RAGRYDARGGDRADPASPSRSPAHHARGALPAVRPLARPAVRTEGRPGARSVSVGQGVSAGVLLAPVDADCPMERRRVGHRLRAARLLDSGERSGRAPAVVVGPPAGTCRRRGANLRHPRAMTADALRVRRATPADRERLLTWTDRFDPDSVVVADRLASDAGLQRCRVWVAEDQTNTVAGLVLVDHIC